MRHQEIDQAPKWGKVVRVGRRWRSALAQWLCAPDGTGHWHVYRAGPLAGPRLRFAPQWWRELSGRERRRLFPMAA